MDNETEITLEQVRTAAERLLDSGKNVSVKEIIRALGRGSAGTVGAFLKQVKTEWRLATLFDRGDFSTELKAALVSEVSRHVKNGEDSLRLQLEDLSEIFSEVCEANEIADKTITSLKRELADTKAESGQKIRQLEIDFVTTKERLSHAEEVKSNLMASRDELSKSHNQALEENAEIKNKLLRATSFSSDAQVRIERLEQQLHTSQTDRDAANQKAALAEQQARHEKAMSDEQRSLVKDLRNELQQAKNEKRDQDALIAELKERLNKAETLAAVATIHRTTQEPKKPSAPRNRSKKPIPDSAPKKSA